MQVRLISRDGTKFWHAERSGATVTTSSGKVGGKPRTSTKTHPTAAKAKSSLDASRKKKAREGFMPETLDEIPLPELEAPEVTDALVFKRAWASSTRNTPPLEYTGLMEEHGRTFCEGPRGTGVWIAIGGGGFEVRAGHGVDVRPVTPPLVTQTPPLNSVALRSDPVYRDDDTMLFGFEEGLYALDARAATASLLFRFESVDALKAHRPYAWESRDGTGLLASRKACVCRIADGEIAPLLELEGGDIVGLVALADGRHAVLQPERLTVFRVMGGKATVTHEIACNEAVKLGTWCGGTVLVVIGKQDGTKRLVAFAVREGELFPMAHDNQFHEDAYDLRGVPCTIGYQAIHRVFNVETVRDRAFEGEPLPANSAIATRSLTDVIIDVLSGKAEVEDVAKEAASGSLGSYRQFTGMFNTVGTALHYALYRATIKGGEKAQRIVQVLVDAGSDLDQPTGDGHTPLGLAYEFGLLVLGRRLRQAGASANPPREVTVQGQTVTVASPLVAAAAKGYFEEVEALLEAGADIDRALPEGTTAITAAIASGQSEVAALLLERGAKVDTATLQAASRGRPDASVFREVAARLPDDVRGPVGEALLARLAFSGFAEPKHRELPRVLSELGARNITAECCHSLVRAGLGDALAAQLEAGADPNGEHITARDPSHLLHLALAQRPAQWAVVEALLEHGADVNLPARNGRKPLSYAIPLGMDFVRPLVERGAELGRGEFAWGPLHAAAAQGRVPELLYLLDAGGDIEEEAAYGQTPLGHAAASGHLDAIRALLERGAAVEGGRFPALMSAARKNQREAIDLLLTAGADPSRRGTFGNEEFEGTAHDHAVAAKAEAAIEALRPNDGTGTLATALAQGADTVLSELLEAGADPNVSLDADGTRPIHRAMGPRAVQLLAEHGAKLDAETSKGHTALQLAARDGAMPIVRALLEAGADPNAGPAKWRPARRAAEVGHLEVLQALIDAGANLDERGTTSPLHAAAEAGQLACVRWLLDRGANVRALDGGEISGLKTPLHLAGARGHLEVVEALLDAGANPNARAKERNDPDWGGLTPLHDAAEAGQLEVVIAMLRRLPERDLFVVDNRNRTAVDAADEHPRVREVLRAVIERGQSIDAVLAAAADAERSSAEQRARGALWIERLKASPGPRPYEVPEAILPHIQASDYCLVTPDRSRCVVLRKTKGRRSIMLADASGILAVPDAPFIDEPSFSAHLGSQRFAIASERCVYELDVNGPTLRVAIEADADVEGVEYVGDLIVTKIGDSLEGWTAAGEALWNYDAHQLHRWCAAGPMLFLVPRANVLGTVVATCDASGVHVVGYHPEKVDEAYALCEGDLPPRVIALGRVGKDWDVENFQEVHGSPSSTVDVALPNEEATLAELPKIAYR